MKKTAQGIQIIENIKDRTAISEPLVGQKLHFLKQMIKTILPPVSATRT
jgi:hypothetical protein